MIVVQAEAHAGAEIRNTADEMQALANKLDVIVRLRFNDVECSAVPGGDAALLAERQQKEQSSKERFKFVSSRP